MLRHTKNGEKIGYSRGIGPYGGPKPPPIDRQGTDAALIEKASVMWHFHGGKRLRLTGSD